MHREPVGEAAVVSTLQEAIETENMSKLPSRSYSGLGHLRPMPTLFPAKKSTDEESTTISTSTTSTTTTTTTTAAPSSAASPETPKAVDSPFFIASLSSLPPPVKQKISATYKQEDIAAEKPVMSTASAVLTNTHIKIKESDRRLDQDAVDGSMKMGGTLSESRGNHDTFYKPVALINAKEKAQNATEEIKNDDKSVKVPASQNGSASIPVYIVHSTEKTTLEPEPIFTIEMTEEEPTLSTSLKEPEEETEGETESFTEEIGTTLEPDVEVEETKQPTESGAKVGPTLSSLLLKPLTASQRTAEVDNMSPIKAGLLFREPKSGPSSSGIKESTLQAFPKNEFNSAPAFLRRNNTIKKTTTAATTTVIFFNFPLPKLVSLKYYKLRIIHLNERFCGSFQGAPTTVAAPVALNCSCADRLQAQGLGRKLCDGVVDCWDFSDETGCGNNRFSNDIIASRLSRKLIKSNLILFLLLQNGARRGSTCAFTAERVFQRRNCATDTGIVHLVMMSALACPLRLMYKKLTHYNIMMMVLFQINDILWVYNNIIILGVLMVQQRGEWGPLCIEKLDGSAWRLGDVARAVCRALTYR
jgi:hypothetical protein